MYKKLQELRARREDGENGFTLIELLVVVVIIGILVAIAIPLYLHFENGAKQSSAQSDVRNAIPAVEQSLQDGGTGSYPIAVVTPSTSPCVNSGSTPCTQMVLWTSSSTTDTGDVINVSPGNTDTYDSDGTNYVVTSSAADGTEWYYANFGADSGHVTKAAAATDVPALPGAPTGG